MGSNVQIVLVINTEGATDPENFERVVPESSKVPLLDTPSVCPSPPPPVPSTFANKSGGSCSVIRAALVQAVAPTSYVLPPTVDGLDGVTPSMLQSLRELCLEQNRCLARRARALGSHVVCFGELCNAPYFALEKRDVWKDLAEPVCEGPTVESMRALAKDLGMVLVVPLYEVEPKTCRRFNTTVVIDSSGQVLGFYRKNHIPCGKNEQSSFSETYYYERGCGVDQSLCPGNVSRNECFPVFQTSVCRIGVATCYDRHFEGVIQTLAEQGAELILCPAVTYGEQSERMWDMEFVVDAMRHSVFVGGLNRLGSEPPWNQEYFGRSFFCSPSCSRLADLSPTPDLVVADLDLSEVPVIPFFLLL